MPEVSYVSRPTEDLSQTELRLVASVEVVGLVPVAGRGHGLATAVTSGITCLGVALASHSRPIEVVGLLIPASTSRGRTYSTSERGLRHNRWILGSP